MIDVAARLKIGVRNDRARVLHDERCKRAHTFGPLIAIERCRRPGLDLFGRVVTARDVVHGGMKHLMQCRFITNAELSYTHELWYGSNSRALRRTKLYRAFCDEIDDQRVESNR